MTDLDRRVCDALGMSLAARCGRALGEAYREHERWDAGRSSVALATAHASFREARFYDLLLARNERFAAAELPLSNTSPVHSHT